MDIPEYLCVRKVKTEDRDQESLSSVSVPPTGRFYEPFMKDLDLIWRVEVSLHFFSPELIGLRSNVAKMRNRT